MIDSTKRNNGNGSPEIARAPIRVDRARVHNLQDVCVDIPRDEVVVITGPSGSGKSSLAYDTIYAEGQRQYIESLSVYARQFLHQMERPDVDSIQGLQPTISIDQRAAGTNPRSTVATITEVYDFLRLLYARCGLPHCYNCGRPIRRQTPEQILDDILRLPEGTRLMLLAPVVRGRRGKAREILRKIVKAGFVRARVDGALVDVESLLASAEENDKAGTKSEKAPGDIEAVIDRVVLKEGIRSRLAESLKLALRHGEGVVVAVHEKERITNSDGSVRSVWKDTLYSTLHSCPKCGISFMELEPRTFSFNSPYGACPTCQGMGRCERFDTDLLIPDPLFSLEKGAVLAWKFLPPGTLKGYKKEFDAFFQAAQEADDTLSVFNLWGYPLCQFDDNLRETLIHGGPFPNGKGEFLGIVGLLEQTFQATKNKRERDALTAFRRVAVCPDCAGSRLRPEARGVVFGDRRIQEVCAMTIAESLEFFKTLDPSPEHAHVARQIMEQIVLRLDFMHRVGLDYLTLDRPAETLSGGELQRVRLATGLGNGLVGVCYVLDEPSIGLHPRDNRRLIDAMRYLKELGNTVLVVEHDEAIMRQADWIIDMGPGAGHRGGRIITEGVPEDIERRSESLTGKYLSGELSIPVPKKRRKPSKARTVTIEGVTTNNLKNVTVSFPLGTFICVTGVSGSGKSSLLNETLVPAVRRRLAGAGSSNGNLAGAASKIAVGPYTSLRGVAKIDKLIQIDQTPIGRSPRSNPATYTGLFDEVRKVFAFTRDAKRRGYKAGRFSFNVHGGRCEECLGQGVRKIEMHFLPEMYAVCPVCEGKRFNRQTLEIKYKGKSIADVLDMQIDDAYEYFGNYQQISRMLESLRRVGLGYLTLGQASTTLSGGEAQRIKLATELARVETGNTLYVLDEPTSGLHSDDIRKLLDVLTDLVGLGNTVIVIEHNLDVMKTADWIIDLGPEGGAAGGEVTACGTPEEIAALEDNHTGRFLREVLKREPPKRETSKKKA